MFITFLNNFIVIKFKNMLRVSKERKTEVIVIRQYGKYSKFIVAMLLHPLSQLPLTREPI